MSKQVAARLFLFTAVLILFSSGYSCCTVAAGGRYADSCDRMLMRDGREIMARVLVISAGEIRYKRCDMSDGPDFVVRRGQVFMIEYLNGSKEYFKEEQPADAPAQHGSKYRSREDSIRKATNRILWWLPLYPAFSMPVMIRPF
jgi:hypothetical protein